MNKKQVQQVLKEQKIRPVKKLGQNFLVNTSLIQRIVKAIQKQSPPFVEVGPGLGALTQYFKKKEIFLIEKDKKLANYWYQKDWTVFCEDALRFNWSLLPKKFTLFGNLPYEIASSLIIQFSVQQKQSDKMFFLIQKEVAERIKAEVGSKNYSLLSVMAQSFWSISNLFSIPKNDFYPVPKVDGRFLEFTAKKFNSNICPDLFFQFVKKCFQFKRKMLFKKLDIPSPKDTLKDLGLDVKCRAENLSSEKFLQLYVKIREKTNFSK
ncbi:MAG: 16S rRNA (adenine(1518)-N(6)/adenine(1519)-N(6))-dimethyltransferase RsmA [Bdellovibrionaceae bacterium]|nr:16S rRNA (adenine(1518)-N(6)/adenine(1519)-N(6))-dimethyltransferase RsmA [Pseudobdellovibrionaceae bacterium]